MQLQLRRRRLGPRRWGLGAAGRWGRPWGAASGGLGGPWMSLQKKWPFGWFEATENGRPKDAQTGIRFIFYGARKETKEGRKEGRKEGSSEFMNATHSVQRLLLGKRGRWMNRWGNSWLDCSNLLRINRAGQSGNNFGAIGYLFRFLFLQDSIVGSSCGFAANGP